MQCTVNTRYNHTNPSIGAFIRHFPGKLERIRRITLIYPNGSKRNWKKTWSRFVDIHVCSPDKIMISMWRRCNLCQADILLMTCLLSLTGHYWVKGNDGWEGWIQTIFQSHRRKSKCRLHGVQLWIIFRLLYEMLAPLSLIEFIFVTASLYQSNSHHCTQWVNCHLSQWNFRFLLACNKYSDACKGFNVMMTQCQD